MADPKKVVDELGARAALAAGKDAAKRAVEDLLSSDEERAAREAQRAAEAKRKRTKLIAYTVIGAILVLGLVGMVMSYWQWFVLAGLLALAGMYGWHRVRSRLRARAGEKREPRVEPKAEKPARVAAEQARPALGVGPVRDADAELREIDDELAAMKARLKK